MTGTPGNLLFINRWHVKPKKSLHTQRVQAQANKFLHGFVIWLFYRVLIRLKRRTYNNSMCYALCDFLPEHKSTNRSTALLSWL